MRIFLLGFTLLIAQVVVAKPRYSKVVNAPILECVANIEVLTKQAYLYKDLHGRFPQKLSPHSGRNSCPVSARPYLYKCTLDGSQFILYCSGGGHVKEGARKEHPRFDSRYGLEAR